MSFEVGHAVVVLSVVGLSQLGSLLSSLFERSAAQPVAHQQHVQAPDFETGQTIQVYCNATCECVQPTVEHVCYHGQALLLGCSIGLFVGISGMAFLYLLRKSYGTFASSSSGSQIPEQKGSLGHWAARPSWGSSVFFGGPLGASLVFHLCFSFASWRLVQRQQVASRRVCTASLTTGRMRSTSGSFLLW